MEKLEAFKNGAYGNVGNKLMDRITSHEEVIDRIRGNITLWKSFIKRRAQMTDSAL